MSSAVEELLRQVRELSPEDRQSFLTSVTAGDYGPTTRPRVDVYGRFAHTNTSVDAFLARKAEEIELEDRFIRAGEKS